MQTFTHRARLTILILLTIFLMGTHCCGPPDDVPTEPPDTPDYTPIFERIDCPEHPAWRLPEDHVYECGYLIVPENRIQPEGPQVRLPVVIFKSTSDNPAPDPVIYLAGGPGFAVFRFRYNYMQLFGDSILETRDLILYSQRGTIFAEPELACPEANVMLTNYKALRWKLAAMDLSHEEKNALLVQFWLDCQDQLLERGINLNMYNTAANAADANDLRIALGYEQVNYFGCSYGTRIGLTLLRDYPEGVRSMILDSVLPPQVAYFSESAGNFYHILQKIFEACAADSDCNEDYANLETTFLQFIDDLNANPVTIAYPLGDIIVDGDLYIELVRGKLSQTDAIPVMPFLLAGVNPEDFYRLGSLLEQVFDPNPSINLPVLYSIRCQEEMPFETCEQAGSFTANLPHQIAEHYFLPHFAFYSALCESWAVTPADPIENKPVTSDVPTLLLSGQFDPVTPPEWGRLAAETLSNSYFYEFPGISHGVVGSSPCALEIVLQFLDNPRTEPNTSCMDDLSGPDF